MNRACSQPSDVCPSGHTHIIFLSFIIPSTCMGHHHTTPCLTPGHWGAPVTTTTFSLACRCCNTHIVLILFLVCLFLSCYTTKETFMFNRILSSSALATATLIHRTILVVSATILWLMKHVRLLNPMLMRNPAYRILGYMYKLVDYFAKHAYRIRMKSIDYWVAVRTHS